jgi:D-alanyl-D-alanine carboxypeptidase
MKTGFICASGFNLVASATRGGKRLIAVVLGAASSPYRGAKAAGLLERGFHRGPLAWLAPSLGSVEALRPVNAAPPDLRDEMCGPHRKRPAAEEADDESTDTGSDSPKSSMLSSLPPTSEKPSSLLRERPAPADPIVVYVGPAKRPAETQFAAVRARLAKAGKLPKAAPAPTDVAAASTAADALKRDPHTAPVPLPAAVSASTAAAAARPTQIATAPASVTPPPGRSKPSGRATPGATDVGSPPWMSFAPAARADAITPLTAAPDAKPGLQVASIPMPRPRPKVIDKRKRR